MSTNKDDSERRRFTEEEFQSMPFAQHRVPG